MIPTLSIIIPTIARPTLCNSLASLREQLLPGDEVIVEFDEPRTGNWGAIARDRGIARAKGSHLLFMDDDDQYEVGGLAIVRKYVAQLPEALHLFQARWVNQGAPGRVKHDTHEFSGGQCPTITICTPNQGAKTPRWEPIGNNVHQDLEFAKLCAQATFPAIPQWIDEIISVCRPIRDDDALVRSDRWLVNADWNRRRRPR